MHQVAFEKDSSQGRLMGVRGSVELKSINSMGGMGLAGTGYPGSSA